MHPLFAPGILILFAVAALGEINERAGQRAQRVVAEITFPAETGSVVRPKVINDMLGEGGARPTAVAKASLPTAAGKPTATKDDLPKIGGGGIGGIGGGIPMFPPAPGGINNRGLGVENGWGHYNEFNYPTRLDRPRALGVNGARPQDTSSTCLIMGITLLSSICISMLVL